MRTINDENYRKIIQRRDPRYDGRFYWGVKTTGIYCRPICPARPKPENILIFKSSTEAETAGYRPCLRCRPDLAPGSNRWEGTAVTVGRALRLMESLPETELNVASLAESLGMTDRHLRRLFAEHLGASPVEILVNRRLHLARQLVVETDQPITAIAFAAGFHSVRRFNEAFKGLYQRPPSAFRKEPGASAGGLKLSLAVRLPYDWETLLGFLRRHQTYGLERVDADSYTRFLGRAEAWVRVTFDGKQLQLEFQGIKLTELRPILARLRQLLDVDHNPHDLPRDTQLNPAGVRIPGCFDPYEIAVSIILGQLVSITQAQRLMQKLVQQYGHRLADDEIFLFPPPERLMEAELEALGLTKQKAGAIRALSRAWQEGSLILSRTVDITRVRQQLAALPGVGPWTVELIAMRCLGDSDAFPRRDLAVQRVLAKGLPEEASWETLRSYLTQILWRDYARTGAST